jgi:hypothetical protein
MTRPVRFDPPAVSPSDAAAWRPRRHDDTPGDSPLLWRLALAAATAVVALAAAGSLLA